MTPSLPRIKMKFPKVLLLTNALWSTLLLLPLDVMPSQSVLSPLDSASSKWFCVKRTYRQLSHSMAVPSSPWLWVNLNPCMTRCEASTNSNPAGPLVSAPPAVSAAMTIGASLVPFVLTSILSSEFSSNHSSVSYTPFASTMWSPGCAALTASMSSEIE
jgi:hypothetical protein